MDGFNVTLRDRDQLKMSVVEKQLNKESLFSKTKPFFLDATETTKDLEKPLPSPQNLYPRVLIKMWVASLITLSILIKDWKNTTVVK